MIFVEEGNLRSFFIFLRLPKLPVRSLDSRIVPLGKFSGYSLFPFPHMTDVAFLVMAPDHVAGHASLMIGPFKVWLNQTFSRRSDTVTFATRRVSVTGRRVVMTGTAVFLHLTHMPMRFVGEENGYIKILQLVKDNRVRSRFLVSDSGPRARAKTRIGLGRRCASVTVLAAQTRKGSGRDGLLLGAAGHRNGKEGYAR